MKMSDVCPLCGEEYDEVRIKTMHHILPKFWYNGKGPTEKFPLSNLIIKTC